MGIFNSKDRGLPYLQAAQGLMDQLRKDIQGIGDLDVSKMSISDAELAQVLPQLAGMLQEEQLGPSAYEQISTEGPARDAQELALQKMLGISEGGLSTEDKNAFRQLLTQVGAQDKATRDTILSDAASRGNLDSGLMYAQQLASGQGATNRALEGALDLGTLAAERSRQGILDSSDMAGSLRSQDYGEQENLARARDVISQVNAANRYDTNRYNLAQQQAVLDAQQAQKAQNLQYNKGLEQERYNAALQKMGLLSGATQNQAGQLSSYGAGQGRAPSPFSTAMNVATTLGNTAANVYSAGQLGGMNSALKGASGANNIADIGAGTWSPSSQLTMSKLGGR